MLVLYKTRQHGLCNGIALISLEMEAWKSQKTSVDVHTLLEENLP